MVICAGHIHGRPKKYFGFYKKKCGKKILFLPHAVRQMSKPDRMISTKNIRQVVQYSELIEDYPPGRFKRP